MERPDEPTAAQCRVDARRAKDHNSGSRYPHTSRDCVTTTQGCPKLRAQVDTDTQRVTKELRSSQHISYAPRLLFPQGGPSGAQ